MTPDYNKKPKIKSFGKDRRPLYIKNRLKANLPELAYLSRLLKEKTVEELIGISDDILKVLGNTR